MRLARINRAVVALGLLVAAAGAAGWILFYVGTPLWLAFAVAIAGIGLAIVTLR